MRQGQVSLLALLALCHHAPDARSRRLSCWRPGFQLWVTLLGKAHGMESMPSEEIPMLTLWFAICLGHRFVKERLTFTILQQARCVTHCFFFLVPFRLWLPHELSESLMHRPLIGISSFDYSSLCLRCPIPELGLPLPS